MKTPSNAPAQHLLEEIQQQPACLKRSLSHYEALFKTLTPMAAGTEKIIALAEGSSKHAVEIAAPFIEEWVGRPLWTYNPATLHEKFTVASLFEKGRNAKLSSIYRHGHLLVVSQSGRTASVLEVLERLQDKNILPITTISNNPKAPLAKNYGNHISLEAGPETAIAATKTFTATLMNLLLWGAFSGKHLKRISKKTETAILERLHSIPEILEPLFTADFMSAIERFSRKLTEVNHFILLSKGPLVSILPEGGLKLTETSSNIVYTDNSESFKHGPKVMLRGVRNVNPNSIYVIPADSERADSLFCDIHHHFWINPLTPEAQLAFKNSRVFMMRFENSPDIPEILKSGLSIKDAHILTLPSCTTIQSIFVGLVAFQLISYYLAVIKGEDPDNPSLSKAVIH